MRRSVYFLCTVLLAVAGLGSDSPREYDDAVKEDNIEGVWCVVANGEDGIQNPFKGDGVQTFRGGKWTYTLGGHFLYDGVYVIDDSRQPRCLEERVTVGATKGETRKYIYRVDGNTLRMAFSRNDPLKPPKSFDERGVFLIVWERVGK
jgi:uncharacterized protein (TIGR03067 family)